MKNCRKFKKLLQYTAFFDIMIMYGISIGLLFICHINLTFYVIYKRRIIRFYFCIRCFGTEKIRHPLPLNAEAFHGLWR